MNKMASLVIVKFPASLQLRNREECQIPLLQTVLNIVVTCCRCIRAVQWGAEAFHLLGLQWKVVCRPGTGPQALGEGPKYYTFRSTWIHALTAAFNTANTGFFSKMHRVHTLRLAFKCQVSFKENEFSKNQPDRPARGSPSVGPLWRPWWLESAPEMRRPETSRGSRPTTDTRRSCWTSEAWISGSERPWCPLGKKSGALTSLQSWETTCYCVRDLLRLHTHAANNRGAVHPQVPQHPRGFVADHGCDVVAEALSACNTRANQPKVGKKAMERADTRFFPGSTYTRYYGTG